MDDVVAVLDAAGSSEAAVFAQLEGGAMATLFAATHPERTSALVLYEAMPRMAWAPDYDWSIRDGGSRGPRSSTADRTGVMARGSTVWPRIGGTRACATGSAKLERLAASPGTAAKLTLMNSEVDVRPCSPSIQAPTLVMHRRATVHRHPPLPLPRRAHPGVALVDPPGRGGDLVRPGSGRLIEEVEEFLTGARHGADPERILATVMFSDIVDSTRARRGDGRSPLARPAGVDRAARSGELRCATAAAR